MMSTLALAITLASASMWNLDAPKSWVSYHLVHPAHQFTGTDKGHLEGKARMLPDGTIQVQVVGKVKDFDSENSNRDEHMMETVEAAKYPNVSAKGLLKVDPNQTSGTQTATAKIEMNLHGKNETKSVPVTIAFDGPNRVHVTGKFDASVEGFGITRPQLLFVPISDVMGITLDVWFDRGQ
ncbi:MAG: YceI family protein [Deltaproteobacteria bacterium]